MDAVFDADLSANAVFALLALHRHADSKGRIFKTQVELAKYAKMHPNRFSDALKELRGHGFILTVKQKGSFHKINPILIRYSVIDRDIDVAVHGS